jgi:hypothetical protein
MAGKKLLAAGPSHTLVTLRTAGSPSNLQTHAFLDLAA